MFKTRWTQEHKKSKRKNNQRTNIGRAFLISVQTNCVAIFPCLIHGSGCSHTDRIAEESQIIENFEFSVNENCRKSEFANAASNKNSKRQNGEKTNKQRTVDSVSTSEERVLCVVVIVVVNA